MHGGMEGREPAHAALIPYHRHHENIPRASDGDVEEAYRLLALTLGLFLRVLAQLGRRAAGESLNAQSSCGVGPASWGVLDARGHICQHDDRKLEALGLVGAHHANALNALFHERRLGHLPSLSLSFHMLDKVAKRNK